MGPHRLQLRARAASFLHGGAAQRNRWRLASAADAVLVHAGCRLAHLARAAPLLRHLLRRREHALDFPRRALPPARRKQAGASVGPDEAEYAAPLVQCNRPSNSRSHRGTQYVLEGWTSGMSLVCKMYFPYHRAF